MTRVLVTGGAGYIGSHTCVELLRAGYDLVVLDNLSNSSAAALDVVESLAGRPAPLVEGDLRDAVLLRELFREHRFDAVVHFAGLKAVGESVARPLAYYANNVVGTLRLLEVMAETECRTLAFSSSATVYGDPERVPIPETAPRRATNPYGQTKLTIEYMLEDLHRADSSWRISLLRYFNPVGAHPSGDLGEDPVGVPNNLMPFIAQVAVGRRPRVEIFGHDYPTRDGTGVRDYIHVVDLARGHVAALDFLAAQPGLAVHNLGTGRGSSVLEVLRAFERAAGQPIPHEFVPRRPGDVAECYADPGRAQRELGWRAELDLQRMCEDAWRWQSKHPRGFGARSEA